MTRAEPGMASIDAQPSGSVLRRVRRVSVVFIEAGTGRPLTVHTVPTDGGPRYVSAPADKPLEWRAAGFNWLRQRGNVGDVKALPDTVAH